MPLLRKILIGFGALIGVVLLLIAVAAVVLFTADWDAFRGEIGGRASNAAGRKVEITGDLDVALSWRPQVRAQGFRIANEDWGSAPDMVRVEDVYFQFRILPLLIGRLELDSVRLANLKVLLEKNAKGEVNWKFGAESAPAGAVKAVTPKDREEFPVLRNLVIDNAEVVYRAAKQSEPVAIKIAHLEGKGGGMDSPIRLAMKGVYQQTNIALDADLGSFGVLRSGSQPYPVKVKLTSPAVDASFDGTITKPLDMQGLKGRIAAKGKNLADLHRLIGLPLAQSPPYQLTGELEESGGAYHLRGFDGKLGSSDMKGDVSVEVERERPKLTAKIASQALDLADIGGFIGAKDEKPQAGKAPEQGKQQANTGKAAPKDDKGGHVIPDTPFRLDKLRTIDADVDFTAHAIKLNGPALENLKVKLALQNGRAALKPFELGIFEGRIVGEVDLDGGKDVPAINATLRMSGVKLGTALKALGVDDKSAGTFQGNAKIATRGGTLHQLAANANGGGIVMMQGGQISNLILELMALDLQESLEQWIGGNKEIAQISCFLAPFGLKEGRITANPWIFDTSDALVPITGNIDLKNETLDLKLRPQPKDFSLFNLRTTIEVEGDLAKREADVNKLDVLAKLVLKTLLAPVMPLISPELEQEAAQQQPCSAVLARIQKAS